MKAIRMIWLGLTLILSVMAGCSMETAKVDPNTYSKIEGMPLTILLVPVGNLQTNCYLVYDPKTLDAIVIDPGAEEEKINSLIKEYKLKVGKIILTHGHGDHTMAVAGVKEATKANVYIHSNDQSILNGVTADRYLMAGENIQIGEQALTVVLTPGHTPGGITLVGNGMAFTGDTLFNGTVGKTNLPGGNEAALVNSIKYLICNLPPETRIFPGHKTESTIGAERDRYKEAFGL